MKRIITLLVSVLSVAAIWAQTTGAAAIKRMNPYTYIANSLWLREFRRRLTQEQIAALMEYDFPGNVRELGNLLKRAIVLEENDFRKLLHERKEMIRLFVAEQAQEEYPDELEPAIKHHVNKVYEKNGRNLSRTADVLKAARNTVRKYLGK